MGFFHHWSPNLVASHPSSCFLRLLWDSTLDVSRLHPSFEVWWHTGLLCSKGELQGNLHACMHTKFHMHFEMRHGIAAVEKCNKSTSVREVVQTVLSPWETSVHMVLLPNTYLMVTLDENYSCGYRVSRTPLSKLGKKTIQSLLQIQNCMIVVNIFYCSFSCAFKNHLMCEHYFPTWLHAEENFRWLFFKIKLLLITQEQNQPKLVVTIQYENCNIFIF